MQVTKISKKSVGKMGYLRSQIEVVRILCQLLKMILNVHKRVFDL